MRTLVLALAAVALGACNCGPGPGTDGGTGGGGATGGGGGTTGGGGGGTAAFRLSVSPATLSLAPGGSGQRTVEVIRQGSFTGDVQLALEGAPTGVTATFTPNPVTGTSAVMALTVPLTATPGTSNVTIKGTGNGETATTPLALTITPQAQWLLIDDDGSDNNNGAMPATPSASDLVFTALLQPQSGASWVTYVVPTSMNGPSFDQVKNFQMLIWYTGDRYGGVGNVSTLSSADEVVLKAFLDQGNRKVLIFSNSYIYGFPSGTDWTTTNNTFFRDYVGAAGGASDRLNNVSFSATGAGTMTNLTLAVAADTPINTYTDPINPRSGTDVLFTAVLDPDGSGTSLATPIAVGRKNVGTAGTSSCVYFGFSFENVTDVGTGTKGEVFARLEGY